MSELDNIYPHLQDLRKRVLRSALSIGVITIFLLTFHAAEIDVLGTTL